MRSGARLPAIGSAFAIQSPAKKPHCRANTIDHPILVSGQSLCGKESLREGRMAVRDVLRAQRDTIDAAQDALGKYI
jgi:hypothetical protein